MGGGGGGGRVIHKSQVPHCDHNVDFVYWSVNHLNAHMHRSMPLFILRTVKYELNDIYKHWNLWDKHERSYFTGKVEIEVGHYMNLQRNSWLKGKFSSGIEGALASTLNHDFNWKQLSELILYIFLLMFSKFIWVTLIQKQQKYKYKIDFEFWMWASHFYYDLKYNRQIQVLKDLSFPGCIICQYCVPIM